MLLEIAVFNFQSAQLAANAGAHRLELCENAHEGGTTASYGTLKWVREQINIPVFPIIRPRGGDFLYSKDEFAIMQQDVVFCKKLGFEGIVVGLLNTDGTVDEVRTAALVELAYPMEVTFHRAFDRSKDPFKAMQTIIRCGCSRILTSGQVPNATDGKELIKQLIEHASDDIIIMPGSGIRSNNIKELASFTGARELHSSARKLVHTNMQFLQQNMQEQLQSISIDSSEITAMLEQLNK